MRKDLRAPHADWCSYHHYDPCDCGADQLSKEAGQCLVELSGRVEELERYVEPAQ